MRRKLGKIMALGLSIALFGGNALTVKAAEMDYTNSFTLGTEEAITIDGSFGDWSDMPCSYEYSWDNSENCWNWGVWLDGECYKTEPGTYSTDVRHMMQMYCDGEYVYLHIIYARNYDVKLNGSDFQFFVNGQMAAYQLLMEGGEGFETALDREAGVYTLEIRHRDTGLSFLNAEGTNGYIKVTEDKINNEIEIRIPLSELQRQNENINVETISAIEFYCPNLMYRRITAVGTSSGPVLLTLMCSGVVLSGWIGQKRKKDGNLQV